MTLIVLGLIIIIVGWVLQFGYPSAAPYWVGPVLRVTGSVITCIGIYFKFFGSSVWRPGRSAFFDYPTGKLTYK
jgi:hypothetical protein